MIKLTPKNYYSEKNIYISNSKVSAYLKSKEYYFNRYITRRICPLETPPVKIGKIVDALLTNNGKLPYKIKVLKKDDPEEYERQKNLPDDKLCTKEQFIEAKARAEKIRKEPFWQWYKDNKAKFQVIWNTVWDGIPICGMADIVAGHNNIIYVDDIKSVSSMKVKSPQHWYWNCCDMGYFRQMGVYSKMAALENPGKKIVCRHIVVTKEMDELYKVFLFNLPSEEIEIGWNEFIETAKRLKNEKDFKDPPLTWDNAEEIQRFFNGNLFEEDGEWEELC